MDKITTPIEQPKTTILFSIKLLHTNELLTRIAANPSDNHQSILFIYPKLVKQENISTQIITISIKIRQIQAEILILRCYQSKKKKEKRTGCKP